MITSCEKAATICCKKQYNEASFIEKMRFHMHLLVCKGCAKLSKKNTQLSNLCDKANLTTLSDEAKSEMKENLNSGL